MPQHTHPLEYRTEKLKTSFPPPPSPRRYEGGFSAGMLHGRGAFRSADGARLFDGEWARGYPLRGAALDADGVLYRAAFDGATSIVHMPDADWAALRAAWPREGAVTAGRPGPAFGPGEEWSGAVALADGTRFEGTLRGLCPAAGRVEAPGGGGGGAVYAGERGPFPWLAD